MERKISAKWGNLEKKYKNYHLKEVDDDDDT